MEQRRQAAAQTVGGRRIVRQTGRHDQAAQIGITQTQRAVTMAVGGNQVRRITGVIDEDFLFAYRDYEMTQGGDGELPGSDPDAEDGDAEDILGQPVAAFAIGGLEHQLVASRHQLAEGQCPLGPRVLSLCTVEH